MDEHKPGFIERALVGSVMWGLNLLGLVKPTEDERLRLDRLTSAHPECKQCDWNTLVCPHGKR